MKLLAIDPGSNTLGWAVYIDGILVNTNAYSTMKSNRIEKMFDMVSRLSELIFDYEIDTIVSEEPLLQGKSNTSMQRLLGWTECMAYHLNEYEIHYISPMSVKAYFGSGKFDKEQLAAAVRKRLPITDEFDKLIKDQKWDATDAVAIGLMFIEKEKTNGNNDTRSAEPVVKTWYYDESKKKTTKSSRNCKSVQRRVSRAQRSKKS